MNKYAGSVILMLVSPVFTLLDGLRSSDPKFIRWIIFAFTVFYASTLGINDIGDGTVHWTRVHEYYIDLQFGQFILDLRDIILFKTNTFVNDDVYIHLLSYFAGSVLKLPNLFFTLVGVVYGYFFAGSLVCLFKRFPNYRTNFAYFVLAVFFILILNFQSMNTVRTWTGFWVMFFGLIKYYETKRLRYLLLLLLPPLIHVGYFVMIIPAWIVVLFNINRYLIFTVYLLSFFTQIVDKQEVLGNLEFNEVGQNKVQGYLIDEEEKEQRDLRYLDHNWYVKYHIAGFHSIAIVIISVVFVLHSNMLSAWGLLEKKMFLTGLLYKVLSNTTWYLYALSNRTEVISNLLILAAILVFWQKRKLANRDIKMRFGLDYLFYFAIVMIIPGYIYYISNILEYSSVFLLFGPFLAWLDVNETSSFRDLIVVLFNV